MADTRIAMMGQPVNIMLPSEALSNAYNLKKSQMQSDMMAGEMRDNALMDQAYRAAGGDLRKMDRSALGFKGGMELANIEATQAQNQFKAQNEKLDFDIKNAERGGSLAAAATDQNGWNGVVAHAQATMTPEQFANFPKTFSLENQDRVVKGSLSGKDRMMMQRDEMRYKEQQADNARRDFQQDRMYGLALNRDGRAADGGSDVGKPQNIVWDASRGVFVDPNTRTFSAPVGQDGGQLPTKSASKPMPASASKLETDLLEDLSVAKGIQTLTKNYIDKIDKGELTLGAATNAMGAFSTKYGELPLVPKADKGDVIREGFLSDMKKLRNDSLRLNKGVQTDGDAQREWETLFNNINNADVVKNTLLRINDLDARAEQLKRVQIDTQRQNFSADPFDYSKIDGIGGGNNAPPPSGVGFDPSAFHRQ